LTLDQKECKDIVSGWILDTMLLIFELKNSTLYRMNVQEQVEFAPTVYVKINWALINVFVMKDTDKLGTIGHIAKVENSLLKYICRFLKKLDNTNRYY
jgi:hypothetical protein